MPPIRTAKQKEELKVSVLAKQDKVKKEKEEHLKKREAKKAELQRRKASNDAADRKKAEEEEAALMADKMVYQYDGELMDIDKELKDIDAMDIDVKEEENAESNPSVIITTESNGGSPADPIVIVDEQDLLQPRTQRFAQLGERKVLVTKAGGRGKQMAIVQYGPPNASVYRREDVTGEDLDLDNDITDCTKRPGEKHEFHGGKKFYERTKKHVVAVQGVAFKDSGYRQDSVEVLNPIYKDSDSRFPPTDVLIKWNYNGVVSTSWETRTVFRRLWWNNKKGAADKDLYFAAQVSEARFEEWQQGKRRGLNRSPTPIAEISARIRAGSLRPTASPSPPAASLSPQPQNQSLLVNNASATTASRPSQAQKTQWMEIMCDFIGKDFNNLSLADNAQLATLWLQESQPVTAAA